MLFPVQDCLDRCRINLAQKLKTEPGPLSAPSERPRTHRSKYNSPAMLRFSRPRIKFIRPYIVIQTKQRNMATGPSSASSPWRVVQHTVNCSHTRDYIGATAHGDADRPKLSVKQYIPLDNPEPKPGDVTIIGAHANGFPKVFLFPPFFFLKKKTSL